MARNLARNRSRYRTRIMPFAYVNIQLELNRWMKRIRLPRTVLRKRYEEVVQHAALRAVRHVELNSEIDSSKGKGILV